MHVRGRPVHVREAGQGANAIEAAYRLIGSLKELEAKWNARRGDFKYFEDLDHPINFNFGEKSQGRLGFLRSGLVHVGFSFAAIYPGVDPRDAAREIEACLELSSREDPFLSDNPPTLNTTVFSVGLVWKKAGARKYCPRHMP
ncbi:MAG: hypothetical protein Ct9H300mP16_14450 [Pseudomonadota bacterium]|nr:MAG: hypothetical protein Ct9H300mP16_14450 [Pseudomonadota bacterium]